MIHLVQLKNGEARRVAIVEEPSLRLLSTTCRSVYDLANAVLESASSIRAEVERNLSNETINYDEVYSDLSEWNLLAPIDHPVEPARCLVSGTGLTHLGSAKNRSAMHAGAESENETDSMKMFRWGIEGGKPAAGEVGTAPEWFYKGSGSILRGHGECLEIPPYAEDGGEEAEIAGVYLIDGDGCPRRLGMAIGNEFSDHAFEKRNYLNLAGSKMRTCSLGPELVIDPHFDSVSGEVTIGRDGRPIWRQEILTGESEMCHSLANIEHHHFKFETHRRPGDAHVHYYGACSLSFSEGVRLADGDVMKIAFEGFGRPLMNPVRLVSGLEEVVAPKPLY